MIGFSRILSISALLAGVLVRADEPAYAPCNLSIVPPQLLELVPDECEGSTGAGYFEEAVCCAFASFAECFGLVGVLSDFQSIPSPSADLTCADIQTPFCTIASTCMRCITEFEELVRCMVTYNPEILTEISSVVSSIVPTDAPSNAPSTPAPSASPTETNSTEVDDFLDEDEDAEDAEEDAEVSDLEAFVISCNLVETCESQQ